MSAHAKVIGRYVFLDLLGSVVWFPAWWYTNGFVLVWSWVIDAMRSRFVSDGLGIWIRNFFVPMYGQSDFFGRIISIVMRSVVLLGRILALTAEAFVYLFGLLVWLLLPVVSLGIFIYSILHLS